MVVPEIYRKPDHRSPPFELITELAPTVLEYEFKYLPLLLTQTSLYTKVLQFGRITSENAFKAVIS
jgi:hypothetical protein